MQGDLTAITNIDIAVISRYEQDLVLPGIDHLQKLAEALKLPVDELLHGPKGDKIKVTVTFNKNSDKEIFDMNSNNNEFTLNLSPDGYISIIGGARVIDKESIRSFIEKAVQQLEAGFDCQVMRGALSTGD